MDGKIIQEVEGIVNGSGFVRISEIWTATSVKDHTINTNFVPKIIICGEETDCGVGLVGCTTIRASGSGILANYIQWTENSVTFTVASFGVKVVVLG